MNQTERRVVVSWIGLEQRRVQLEWFRCLLQVANPLLRLLHIQNGNRRTAVCANRICGEVDGRAAIGAIHCLDLLPQFIDLFCGYGSNETLFSQEVEITDKSSVFVHASPVTESSVSL